MAADAVRLVKMPAALLNRVKEMRSCSLPVFSARLMLLKCRLSQITNAWFRVKGNRRGGGRFALPDRAALLFYVCNVSRLRYDARERVGGKVFLFFALISE